MRVLIILSLVLNGCVSNQNARVMTDSQGRIVQTNVKLKSSDYVKLQAVQAAEQSNAAYFNAQAEKYKSLSGDGRDVALVTAIEALSGQRNPTNYNDVQVAEQRAKTQRFNTVAGGIMGLVQWGAAGYLGGKAIDAIANKAAINVNGDNNQIRGTNTGNNSNVNYTEAGGIPLSEGEVQPIRLGSTEDSSISECPEGLNLVEDERGRGCSDGMGGFNPL